MANKKIIPFPKPKVDLDYITMTMMLYTNSIFLPVAQDDKINQKENAKMIGCGIDILNSILGQTHANIIDAILYNAVYKFSKENSEVNIDNSILYDFNINDSYQAVFPINSVLNMVNIPKSRFHKKIKDLITVKFEMTSFFEQYSLMSLVADIADYNKDTQNHTPYQIITFSLFFVFLLKNFYNVSYPKTFVPKILDLKYPINQAIARYCLANNEINERLEDLLIQIGVYRGQSAKKNPIIKILKQRYFNEVAEEKDKLYEYFEIHISSFKNQEPPIIKKNKNKIIKTLDQREMFIRTHYIRDYDYEF